MSILPSDLEGSIVLVGITHVAKDGSETMEQYSGVASVLEREDFHLIELHCDDGKLRQVPFDEDSLSKAPSGEYRLKSTGKIVTDPHYLMTWVVHERLDS